MPVDPYLDPWGAAMLGAAALGGLALLMVLVSQLAGRRTVVAGWLLGLSLFGFLGSAVAGTLERVQYSATNAETGAESGEGVDADGSDPDGAPHDSGASPPPGADTGESGDSADAEANTKKADAAPSRPPPVAVGSALKPVPALPSDASARKSAIRKVLRDAKLLYENESECKSAPSLGQVWAAVSALPAEAPRSRAEVVTRRLEECRRSLRWSTAYVVHRDRVAARDAFESQLSKRLSKVDGLKTFIKLSGKNHEKMRIGSGKLDDELAASVMTEALKAELTELGFERVVLASGNKTWKTALEPRPESEYIVEALRPYGLHLPLKLPKR